MKKNRPSKETWWKELGCNSLVEPRNYPGPKVSQSNFLARFKEQVSVVKAGPPNCETIMEASGIYSTDSNQ